MLPLLYLWKNSDDDVDYVISMHLHSWFGLAVWGRSSSFISLSFYGLREKFLADGLFRKLQQELDESQQASKGKLWKLHRKVKAAEWAALVVTKKKVSLLKKWEKEKIKKKEKVVQKDKYK